MKYDNETIDALAAEYVLGTLKGAPRKRFARLMIEDKTAREAVWRWERQLNSQVDGIAPEKPGADVWTGIAAQIDGHKSVTRDFSWIWRALSGALAILVVVLTLPLLNDDLDAIRGQVALIEDEGKQPLWLITVDEDSGLIRTRAINVPAQQLDLAYELWALVDGTPRSLGLLPVSSAPSQTTISPAVIDLVRRSSGLAVSLEPAGGSPTGLPTGPVLYQAQVFEL